jgi:MoxR-like ATPase
MLHLQGIVRRVPISDLCVDYVARLVRSTRPADAMAPQFIRDWVLWGVGPRGGQSLIMAARARAALDGRPEVGVVDIAAMAPAVLRHRMVLNYTAESQGQTTQTVVQKLLDLLPLHPADSQEMSRVQRVLK